jgi:hypothetical protein
LDASSAHGVACHFWREIAPPDAADGGATVPPNPRLHALQAMFRAGAAP